MSLSQWDLKYLNPQEQQEVLDYKNQWANNPNQQGSVHNVAEEIRAKYGYSGGADGSQYIPINNFAPPTAPDIPTYESQYSGQINDIFEQIKNPPKYDSPYADLINQSISSIVNRPKFNYDPESDAAYQAFKQRALRAGDKAYADNLGGLSSMTGGRANSWAGTVASQARNQYVLQAEEAVIQFEERAYGRYKDETSEMYNLVNLLNSQDETAYNRYRDKIGDTKDLADMVLKLDERDFDRYKYMSDQTWKVFDTEYQQYNDALQFKKDKINEALDRTNLQGYVNNQDSIVLGVPTGTLSQGARERAENMADYIRKQELDLKNLRKEKEMQHEFDIKLINAREKSAAKQKASSASKQSTDGFTPNTTEANKINSVYKEFSSLTSSKDFKRLSRKEKYNSIAKFIDNVVYNVSKNMYGKNSIEIGKAIVEQILNDPAYKQYYENIDQLPQIEKEIEQISKPGFSMNDFLIDKYMQRK